MDPIAFSIFGIDVAWYGIIIALGILVGTVFGLKEAERVGISEDQLLDFLILAIPLSILGARLYYVIFRWDIYKGDLRSILDIRGGGLAIHGGIIMAVLVALIYTRVKNINFFTLADLSAPSLAIGQAIGRWGNYINQEAYGSETDLPWGILIEGTRVHPTFLYESIWNLGLFFFLVWYRKKKQLVAGEVFAIYLAGYSFIRYFIEALRTDSLMLGSFKVAQIVSIVGFILGLAILYLIRKKYGKKDDIIK